MYLITPTGIHLLNVDNIENIFKKANTIIGEFCN